MKSTTAIGTPGLLGYARVEDNSCSNLSTVALQTWESIRLTPVEYCYLGGIENGKVRKSLGYPLARATGETRLLQTKTVVLSPGRTYSVMRLEDSDALAVYAVVEEKATDLINLDMAA